MKRHPYELISKKALNVISRKSWNWGGCLDSRLSKSDKEDCVGEGVLAILLAIKKKPEIANLEGYLFVVAKNAILQFLFGGTHHQTFDKTRNIFKKTTSLTGWLNPPLGVKKSKELPWIERNQSKIYDLLLSLRKQKGGRNQRAVNRDLSILIMVSWGWDYSDIAKEMNLSPNNIRDYRKQLIRKLKEFNDGNQV